MRIVRLAALAVLMSLALSGSFCSSVLAQGDEPGNVLLIDVDMVLSGLASIEGNGDLLMRYEGPAAADLRQAIESTYSEVPNTQLSVDEVREFLIAFTDALTRKAFWGVSISSSTEFRNSSDERVRDYTMGLVNSNISSSSPCSINVEFDGTADESSKLIQLSQGPIYSFSGAVRETTGYDFAGDVSLSTFVTSFGFAGFTGPNLTAGHIEELRTPVGNLVWYSVQTHVSDSVEPADETLTYEQFSIYENQQIAFVLLFISVIVILRLPAKRFEKYKMQHHRKFRRSAKPIIYVRVSAWALAALVTVLYFLPFVLTSGSGEFLMYGMYLYFVIPAAVVGEYFFSKVMYDRAALKIPEETVVEVRQALVQPEKSEGEMLCQVCFKPIEAGLEILQCGCGFTMHVECAERAQTCPSCGSLLFPERTRSIQCKSCGETFLYYGAEDPYSIQCTRCGAFQEEVEPGKNYLVVDKDSRNAYMMLRAMGLSGRPAVCMTSEFPGKIREEYDLGDSVEIKWFSDSSTDIDNINPKDLEGDAMEIASTFLMTTKNAGLLIDAVRLLIDENGFDKVNTFIKKLNEIAAMHSSTIILALNRGLVSDEQYKTVSGEFSEIHDFS
jgi:hypothetical protein